MTDTVHSVRGNSWVLPDTAACDAKVSELNERIHRARETGRLVAWIPTWQTDIDRILEHRTRLAKEDK